MTTMEAKLARVLDLLIDQGREIQQIRESIDRLRELLPEDIDELRERVAALEAGR